MSDRSEVAEQQVSAWTKSKGRIQVLVLYTEIAPYVLAGLRALVEEHPVDVHLVRWPVNAEAPFHLDVHPRITVRERSEFDDDTLLVFARSVDPALVITSGWMDKGYMRTCRALRRGKVPVIMNLDTAWRGTLRQWINAILARFWMHRTFSHIWATGSPQVKYARQLGYGKDRIRTGLYTADTTLFSALGERLLVDGTSPRPHRFLCVARYIPSKGHQLLCDAFAELHAEGLAGDWELWFSGTGESFKEVAGSPSGRHERIKHLGFKQAQEMQALVEQCGVFVLPSLYEPWGVVVHEHACGGMPLLLSSAVGAGERFLVEASNGHRFVSGDKASLKTMLRMFILSSDEELRAMGKRSTELGNAWNPSAWARTAVDLIQRK